MASTGSPRLRPMHKERDKLGRWCLVERGVPPRVRPPSSCPATRAFFPVRAIGLMRVATASPAPCQRTAGRSGARWQSIAVPARFPRRTCNGESLSIAQKVSSASPSPPDRGKLIKKRCNNRRGASRLRRQHYQACGDTVGFTNAEAAGYLLGARDGFPA